VHISSRGGGPCSSDTVRRKRRCRVATLAVLVFCVVGLAGYLKQRRGELDHLPLSQHWAGQLGELCTLFSNRGSVVTYVVCEKISWTRHQRLMQKITFASDLRSPECKLAWACAGAN
jgi:hypothetical protein